MPNLAALLKQEISRLVRKELKTETEALRKTSARYRAEIADLKRRVADLEKQRNVVERKARTAPQVIATATDEEGRIRFSADGLKKHRERLNLSAPVLASLLGVSPQSIYNWESGTSKPGKDFLSKIAALRKMGKREVQRQLSAGN